MGRWPSGQSVTLWDRIYADHTAALYNAMSGIPNDSQAAKRLSTTYRAVAKAWRALSLDQSAPLWARHGAIFAAESFDQKANAIQTHIDHENGEIP